jgi:LmbE family N-acetylglucosaminyl deacetylase
MNVLAVFAHPDDEVLAAGATMARYAREGHSVHVAILGEGITSRFQSRDAALDSGEAREALEHLKASVRRASTLVGARDSRCYSFPDNRFDSVPLLDVIKVVEELKAEVRPSIVLTHHAGDMNVDHGVVASAVLTAFRSLPDERPCAVLAGEILSSTDYSVGLPGRAFEPNLWVPVEEADLQKKIAALASYEGEIRDYPHPRSKQAVDSLARYRGAQCGVPSAEAFRLLRGWGFLPAVGV